MGVIRHISLFILIGVFCFTASPQVQFPLNLKKADSLERLLPFSKGKEKVDILNGISISLIRHYSNKSDSLATLALDLSKKLNYKDGLAKALYCKGANAYILGNFIEGFYMLNDAVDIFKESADTVMIFDTYLLIAAISYFSLTDRSQGIEVAEKCLVYSIAANDKQRTALMYSALQYLWGTWGHADIALQYLEKHRIVAKDIVIPKLEQAMVVGAYGRYFLQAGDYQKALDQYLKAFQMVNPDSVEQRAFIAQLCNSNGNVYLKLGIPDSAFYYFDYGMRLARKYQNYYSSVINAMDLARWYYFMKDEEKAEIYCDSALFFGQQIYASGSFYGIREYSKMLGMSGELYIPLNKEFKRYIAWSFMAQSYQLLITIYENRKQCQKSFVTLKSQNAVRDSINGFQKRKEILDLQYKYQTKQKDNQILLLSQDNQLQSLKISRNRLILFAAGLIVVLIVLVFVLLLRQSRVSSREQVTEFKQKLLRSQMNPHFIFNSLTSIQNFIIKHDEIKASVYLSRFSDLVRSILSNSMAEQITLEEELNTIENYLELQKVRYQDKFEYKIEVEKAINPESVLIPPMLAQPFIENAIEHGFKQKSTKGNIHIRLKLSEHNLIYEVEDDGIGRQKAQEILHKQNKDHKSLATSITQERIKVLNKKLKHKIKLEIFDLKNDNGDPAGTKVEFKIPKS